MQDEKRPVSTPRLKAVPMQSNPDLLIGIGEKGGISVYGLNRFPLTLYFEQWQTLLSEDTVAEVIAFGESHPDLLSTGRETAKATEKTEFYTVNASDVAIVAAEAAKLTAEGNVAGAIKYATIATVAQTNKYHVSPEQMLEIMQLKARK